MRPEAAQKVQVSIVVPLYNEQDNVALLQRSVAESLRDAAFDYELVLIDDGSRDETFVRAAALVKIDSRVRVIRLRRNYGQTAAMAAGIRHARGRVIVTMDGDLQNDPADIPRLVARLDEGYDIVAGWRRRRKDGWLRVFISKVANRIIAAVVGARVKDSGCSLKAFHGDLVRGLPLYGDLHRFIPAVSRLAGARLVEVEVNHRPRDFGVSKYGFSRIWKVMLDIISVRFLLHHARHPLRRHVQAAMLLFLAAFGLLDYAILFSEQDILLVTGALGILAMSFGMFIAACGLLGFIYTFRQRDAACYALLAATVHSSHDAAAGERT